MIKSELVEQLAKKNSLLSKNDVDAAFNTILEHMASTLSQGESIQIRGFGTFSCRYHAEKRGRNPKTGETLTVDAKHSIHFKPGKELRIRVNQSRNINTI